MFADYFEEIPTQGAVAVAGIATGDSETSPDRDDTLADTCPRASVDSLGRFQSGHDNGDNGNRRREVTEEPAGDAAAGVPLTGRR